ASSSRHRVGDHRAIVMAFSAIESNRTQQRCIYISNLTRPRRRSVLLSVLWIRAARCERAFHHRRMFDTSQQRVAPVRTDVPAQADGGATILEIGQQPGAWREVSGRPEEPSAAFLRAVTSRPDLRVVLTGAGSSAFLGEIAAPALRRHLGRR